MERRRALQLTGAAAVLSLRTANAAGERAARNSASAHGTGSATLASADEAFLDEMERSGCLFFLEQADPVTGQVLDRAKNRVLDGTMDPRNLSSIAATGFGLTALCIAHKRGYASASRIEAQVARTLTFHAHHLHQEHGFFCHFNDVHTGVPIANVEYSSVDTALLLCGVLTARAYFSTNAQIVQDATLVYERVDWPWMLNGGDLFRMGWKTGSGFLTGTWNHYCELMMIPLLALGSPTHPVQPVVWSAWSRPQMDYDGLHYLSGPDPLFVHQYSHAWFDFRDKHDAFTNYFHNSIVATEAHRLFCLNLGPPYSARYWGITASDSEQGYKAWGGPPSFGGVNGTAVPSAAAGSLPFLPTECLETLRALKNNYGQSAWGRYGFCDALHPDKDWYDPDVLGIDIGIGVLMAENLRSGFVWKTFAQNPEIGKAMLRAGFLRNADGHAHP